MSGRPQQRRNASRPSGSANASTEDWVAVGEVMGTFGVRGELKIAPLTDFPDRFERTPLLYVGDKRTPMRVLSARSHKAHVLLTLEGVASLDDAERLRGARLYIQAGDLHPLEQNQYYLHDMLGLRVRHVNGTSLGTIADVVPSTGNDLFVVRNDTTGAETLLPVVKAFIKEVDLAGGVIIVDPIPGLFDDGFEDAR